MTAAASLGVALLANFAFVLVHEGETSLNWWALAPIVVLGVPLWAWTAWSTWYDCGRDCPQRRNRWHTHRHGSWW